MFACSSIFFGQQHLPPRVFHSLMAAPTMSTRTILQLRSPDDFARRKDLNQWYKNHSGEHPSRTSDDSTEASLARWLDKTRSRRARSHRVTPSDRKRTASETAQLNNLMTTQRFKTHLERCNKLRQWCLSHSGVLPRGRVSLRRWCLSHPGERPGNRSEIQKQTSLASWLCSARVRRDRAINTLPSGRQLTAKETAQLNSILASASKSRTTTTDLNPVPEGPQQPAPSISKRSRQKTTKDETERCEELQQWFMNHAGERPRRRSDDKTEASLAWWLDRALIRRTRAVSNRPCTRQLTTEQTARLNSILAQAPAPSFNITTGTGSSGCYVDGG